MVELSTKQSYHEQLVSEIRRTYQPQNTMVEEMARNIVDCMSSDLEENRTSYFSVPEDPFEDTIEYVRFCGGFQMFDWEV